MDKPKLSLALAALVCAVLISAGASAKTHNQAISHDSALAMCKGHGGGTECSFCHGGHCHIVSCGYESSTGKCNNHVIANLRGRPGNIKTPVNTVKGGNAGPHKELHHPVQIGSGLKPIVSSSNHGSQNQIGRHR